MFKLNNKKLTNSLSRLKFSGYNHFSNFSA